MRGHTPFFELQAALGEAGCPICALTVRTLERFFAGLVYEKVNDRSLRESIRRAYGLCAIHGTMLRASRSALGVAIIQRDVLRAAAAAISTGAPPARSTRGWRATLLGDRSPAGLLTPDGPCVACQLADETAAHWAGVLGQHYAELRSPFQSSGGLCVSDLRAALAVASAEVAAAIRADQLAIWARLEAELDAWSRATTLLAGDERAAGSRRGRP
jgi:Family of unknown function (DUF6062)